MQDTEEYGREYMDAKYGKEYMAELLATMAAGGEWDDEGDYEPYMCPTCDGAHVTCPREDGGW